MADVIVFWIPRDLDTLPGFTTNIEWGAWHRSGKVVLGAPPDAPKMRYLAANAEVHHIPFSYTLRDTLETSLSKLGQGAERGGGERWVPLDVWRTRTFQRWYEAQRAAGHRLDEARLDYQLRVGPDQKWLFLWIMRVVMYLPEEQRHKANEVIVSRLDSAHVLAYYRDPGQPDDPQIVLVREFRSAATGQDAYVWELPGGSCFEDTPTMHALAQAELQEETGVTIGADRLTAHGSRQSVATLLPHHAYLFSVSLTAEEAHLFESQRGIVHGSDDSERTTVHLVSMSQILHDDRLDWTNLGMICSILGATETTPTI